MEKVLSQEERIRRAEEIYLRRARYNNNTAYRHTSIDRTKERTCTDKYKLLRRIALQIVISLLLYCMFYLVYTTEYSFSDITINKIDEILSYDINFDVMYKYINEHIMMMFSKENDEENNIDNVDTKDENQDNGLETQNIESNEENKNIESSIEEENIETNIEEPVVESIQEINNSEEDSLKNKYSIIVPVTGGYISSRFGTRESTSNIVSTNHKGIDIAVPTRYNYTLSYVGNGGII